MINIGLKMNLWVRVSLTAAHARGAHHSHAALASDDVQSDLGKQSERDDRSQLRRLRCVGSLVAFLEGEQQQA